MGNSGPVHEVALAVRKMLTTAKKAGAIENVKLKHAQPAWEVTPSNDAVPFQILVESDGVRRPANAAWSEQFVSYLDPEVDAEIRELIEVGCLLYVNHACCLYALRRGLARLRREKVVKHVREESESTGKVIYVGLPYLDWYAIVVENWSYLVRRHGTSDRGRRVQLGTKTVGKVLGMVRSAARAEAAEATSLTQ